MEFDMCIGVAVCGLISFNLAAMLQITANCDRQTGLLARHQPAANHQPEASTAFFRAGHQDSQVPTVKLLHGMHLHLHAYSMVHIHSACRGCQSSMPCRTGCIGSNGSRNICAAMQEVPEPGSCNWWTWLQCQNSVQR